MIYIIIGLAILALIFGYFAFRLRLKYKVMGKMNEDDLKTNAANLAEMLRDPKSYGQAPKTLKIIRTIKKEYGFISKKIANDEEIYMFEQLIYENYHNIMSEFNSQNFKSFALLPHKMGRVRIIVLAEYLVNNTMYSINKENIKTIIDKFNEYTPLESQEIASLPLALLYVLVSKISEISSKSKRLYYYQKTAKKCDFAKELAEVDEYLYFRSKFGKTQSDKVYMENYTGNLDNIQYIFTEKLAIAFKIVKNIVASLNFIKKELDGVYLMSINHTNMLLERDSLYKSMDILSKRDYLNIIEEVAHKHKIEERTVVEKLFELQSATSEHFGKYLFEEKETLKHYINNGVILTYKKGTKIKEIYFISAVWLLTAAITAIFGVLTSGNIGIMIATLILSPFFVLPLMNHLLIDILSITLKQKPTPKLDLAELPDTAKTMVILPTFIGSEEAAESAINKIKEFEMSNKGKNICFALLVDYKKSKQQNLSSDRDLNKLFNQKLCGLSDVNVFVRRRVKQGKFYSGFERKRGAILDLCEMLEEGTREKFDYIMREDFEKPTFIATFDDDNTLLPNTILNSVSRMIHPLNAKYDLMTFKSKYDLYSMNTLYSKRYNFDCGYNRYLPSNSFYYNFFGKGIYCGKGIFRLDAYYAKLHNLFPKNRILSHDIIEGGVLRTGELPEVAFENAPCSIPSALSRQNRWFKGDLLLGGFLRSKIKNDDGEVKKMQKPPIYNHIIVLNIMSGFAKLGLLISLLMAFIGGSFIYYVPFILGFFTEFFVCLLRTIDGTRHNIKPIFVARNIAGIICDMVISLFLLPIYAINNLIVAASTLLCRLSSKDRLSWTTFSQSQSESGVNNYCKFVVLQCLTMLGISIIFAGNILVVSYCAIFIALAFAMYITSFRLQEKQDIIPAEKQFLLDIARRTYKYFAMQSCDELVTDNIQIRPFGGKSPYTSPTNLGFSLLSEICAFELGIISKDEVEQRLNAKLKVLDAIEKYKGNFYNWYKVEGKVPAYPFYISSVDNGNMLACLIVVHQFILKHRLYGIEVVNALIADIDLDFLLDKNKNLFYIGYNVQTNSFDNYYDLMASEARILYYLYAAFYQNAQPWDNLSRDCVKPGGNTLVSWSGTMFEYLLPNIFIRAPQHSLLYQTEKNVVKLAIKNKCQNMWGISESGYYKFDDNLRYQYFSFGMQQVAIRNTPNACVIAPYASCLALRINAKESIKNLKVICRECGLGEYGFYESIDITSRKHIIYQYMSHHQGMILASITNAICGNNISAYFESDQRVKSTKILLSERPITQKSFAKPPEDFVYKKFDSSNFFSDEKNWVAALSNGKYTGFFNSFGDNLSHVSNVNICKYHHTFEDFGIKNFVYDLASKQRINYYPKKENDTNYSFQQTSDMVKYVNLKADCAAEIYVPNCLDGEVRKFEINCKNFERICLRGYGEVTLQNEQDYIAHPAFKDMFITSKKYDDNTVVFRRKGDVKRYFAIRIIGLDNIVFECNKSNCCDIFSNEIKFGGSEKPDSFGDTVYPIFTYNSEKDCSKLDKFEYYQVMIYAESYSELTNKLAAINDRKAVYNLIYSAKLPALSAMRKVLDTKTNFEFFGRLTFKLKYGKYSQEALQNKLSDNVIERLNICGLSAADDIIYLNTLDTNLLRALLKCLRLSAPLTGRFVVFVPAPKDGLFGEILAEFGDVRAVLCDNKDVCYNVRKSAFCVINSEIIIVNDYKKSPEIEAPLSSQITIPEPDIEDRYGAFCGENYILKSQTKKPFSNVICGKYGGFVQTNNGECFTYFGSSRNDKITEWRGEAYGKTDSERILLYCGGKCWQLNKQCEGGTVKYGQGFIDFACSYNGLLTNCLSTIVDDGKSKIYVINVQNNEQYPMSIKVDMALKLALGVDREKRNIYAYTQGNVTAAVNVSTKKCVYIKAFSCDLYSEMDNNCILHNTAALDIEGNGSKKIVIAMSSEKELLVGYDTDILMHKFNQSLHDFAALNNIKIETNMPALDNLFNNWLMYQTYSARLCGRCGYYQVGGAIGFRDQLQDCLAYMYCNKEYARQHIISCAERQFVEGDVLHWWHGYAEGVRTKISDDKLFLPYLTAEYIDFSSDFGLLDEQVSYLHGVAIPQGHNDLYMPFTKSNISESMYSHCVKAMTNALKFGAHGLLLIGEGDWNDALNAIGNDSEGESVWLSMFCYYVIEKFKKYLRGEDKVYFKKMHEKLKVGIDNAWNGSWFNRAYTKNGEWLGSPDSDSCKIDLISQAFSVISGASDEQKAKQALNMANNLVSEEHSLVKLLAPPFNDKKYYGYISNYPEGVRENGGQYTHAVAWYIKALAKIDMAKAMKILNMIIPSNISANSENYKNEPFVMSADVYLTGEGGWSWYTGSSAWMYKVILNDIIGINFEDSALIITPNKVLGNYKVTINFAEYRAKIDIRNTNESSLTISGKTTKIKDNAYKVRISNDISEYDIVVEY